MTELYIRPRSMSDAANPYCPGCGHGMAHKLIGEVIDELGISERTIGIVSAGCSVRSWRLYRLDMVLTAHGRSPAVATGIKRACPENLVFVYQGDGDSAAIGLSELMHAALRCERITIFMINNAIYGATGGQAAPTTLIGQKTTSYPLGRDPNYTGFPLNMAEAIAGISRNSYVARVALNSVRNVLKARNGRYSCLQNSGRGTGFLFRGDVILMPHRLAYDTTRVSQ